MTISWHNTHCALANIAEALACSSCGGQPQVPTRYLSCGHIFCQQCVGGESRCQNCNQPVEPTEVYEDNTIASLIHECNVIASIVQKCDLWGTSGDKFHSASKKAKIIPAVPIKDYGKKKNVLSNISTKNINKRNPRGETPLHCAVLKCDEESINQLFAVGADPNTKDNAGWTPLQEAVSFGYINMCRLLLEGGAAPNIPGTDNRTALHEAAIGNRVEEAELLLRHNANVNVFDKYGKTPRDYAKSEDMQKLLDEAEPLNASAKFADVSFISESSFSVTQGSTVCVYGLKLSKEKQELLMRVAAKHRIRTVSQFKPSVTHVLVETNGQFSTHSSYDTMMAILHGCWLLDSEWLTLALMQDDINILDHSIFELDAAPILGVPKRARENAQKKNPGLFNHCNFYFTMQSKVNYQVGEMEFTKEGLVKLITAGGGNVLTREPDAESIATAEDLVPFHNANNPSHSLYRCTHYVIYAPGKDDPRRMYNMPHIKSLPLIWLTESIERFTLVDPSDLGINCR